MDQINEYNQTFVQKAKQFLLQCQRVLKNTRKPTNEEFKTIVKVSGLGIIIVGAIGFVIYLVKEIVKRGGL